MADIKFLITAEQLKSEYQVLGSMLKVAEKYGVSKKLVMNRMNRHGIKRNKRPKWEDTVICVTRHLRGDVTAAEVASATGYTTSTVGKIARKVGFKLIDPYHKGFILTHNGYRMIPAPANHPGADSKGYIREHRLIMELEIKRLLEPGEIVHHVNHVKTDNRIENLELTTLAEHTRHHHTGKVGRSADKKPRKRRQ